MESSKVLLYEWSEMNKKNNISSLLLNITQDMVTYLDQENTSGEGWNYYCNGQVVNALVNKNMISGIIREILDDYNVEISVEENEILYSCNCSSEKNICEHVVSLLYSWVFDSIDFIRLDDFIDKLKIYDKDELISMIKGFIVDNPMNIKYFKKKNMIEGYDFEDDDLLLD